jgi:hypothetical protein
MSLGQRLVKTAPEHEQIVMQWLLKDAIMQFSFAKNVMSL